MARKPKRKQRRRKAAKPGLWARLGDEQRRRVLRGGGTALLVLSLIGAGSVAMVRLQMHVREMVVERADATVALVDLPAPLVDLADRELRDSLADIIAQPDWMDDRICRAMATRLEASGWVAKVNHFRRSGDARFEVSCQYRLPFAMVQQDGDFYLVDVKGVQLPGMYLYDPAWRLIQGVEKPPPRPGARWEGDDLRAGLRVAQALRFEPFSEQITAVLVENFDGRADIRRSHLELATDRAGGRIRWGSAPGLELEENSVEQKLAILRENYRRTGRADANNPIIDVSTFADRFTIPG